MAQTESPHGLAPTLNTGGWGTIVTPDDEDTDNEDDELKNKLMPAEVMA